MVLLLVIGGVAGTAIALLRSGIAEPLPQATDGQVTDLNWSIFTAEGLAYIDRSRQVRIDFSDPPVEAEPLALPENGEVTIGPKSSGDVDLDYSLIVNGGGEAPGGAKLVVTELTITTVDGAIESIIAPNRSVWTFRFLLDQLSKRGEVLGWEVDRDAIFAQVEAATRAGEPYTLEFGPGDRVGVQIGAIANCDTSSYCVLEYVVTPAVR